MTRRQLYAHVADLMAEAGGARPLLDACRRAMRFLRDLPVTIDPLVKRLAANHAFRAVLQCDDALGRIYQAINAPVLEGAYRAARRERRKFTDAEIPAVTQLFTPRFVVEFLLHNTLGRLWLEMHPDSRLELPWLADPPKTTRSIRPARDLRLLDPACGTMNFGVVATELLEAMYREELDRAGRDGWPTEPSVDRIEQVPSSIARHNLFGIDIDPVALHLASATLEMKLRTPLAFKLHRADALFDDIDGRFDVVVTNPPYLSARHLPKPMVDRLKQRYPRSWRDACAAFIDRSIDLLRDGGRAGVLAMQSFMFTGSYRPLREMLDSTVAVETIAHFGGGLFDIGNPGTLQTAAVVVRREADERARRDQPIVVYRLTDADDKEASLRARHGEHRIQQHGLAGSARGAWTYWLAPALRHVFAKCPKLAQIAPPRQGLATTDNARFVRYWWEVEPSSSLGKWFPYAKGGRFRRWYEAPRHRVDWADDGAAIKRSIVDRYPYLNGKWAWVAKNASFYGRWGGLTYSYLTSGRFSARRLEAGAIFDVAGSAMFPDDPLTILGVLNASTAHALLRAINPTVNFQVGDLAELPVPQTRDDELPALVQRAIDLQRTLDTYDETTTDFLAPMPWRGADDVWHDLRRRLSTVEARIDRLVAKLYGVEDPTSGQRPRPAVLDRTDLARRWVNHSLRRIALDDPAPVLRIRPADPKCVKAICDHLAARAGPVAAEQIDRELGGITRFLERHFFTWHAALYERRPVLWVMGDDRRELLLAHERATRCSVGSMLCELNDALPDGWDRAIDDGIAVNLAPLRRWVRDRRQRAWLERVGQDLEAGRFAWSVTSKLARMGARTPIIAAGHPAPGGAARRPRRQACARRGAGRART